MFHSSIPSLTHGIMAARVCLRMSQRVLRKPPLDVESDNSIAEAIYNHFRTVIPHSEEDIRRFESIHSRLIEERLVKYPSKANAVVSRMSLSLLYGAIVCSAMSDSYDLFLLLLLKNSRNERSGSWYTCAF